MQPRSDNRAIWMITLVGAVQIPIVLLARYLILGSSSQTFSGVSGLSLGLAIIPLIYIAASLVVAVASGFVLRFMHFNRPFLSALVGSVLLHTVHNAIVDPHTDMSVVVAVVIGIIVGTACFALPYLFFKQGGNKAVPVVILGIIITVSFLAGSTGGVNKTPQLSNQEKSRQYNARLNRENAQPGFIPYAPDESYFDNQSLEHSDELTIVHAETKLQTPSGTIEVKQAAIDKNLSNLFIPPNSCDHQSIYDYIGVWGKKNYATPTTKKCTVEYEADGRVVMMADITDKKIFDSSPYVARIGDTIIVFHAFNSTAGDFQGTPLEARSYILDFIKNARPLENPWVNQ